MNKIKVGTINNGVVIDHIDLGKGKDIYKILNLEKINDFVVIARNLKSNKINKKELLKIEGKELNKEELNKIALICENATINIIKEQKVSLKYKAEIPENIEDILQCNNPNCITNIENIKTKFICLNKNKNKIKCFYCEKNQNHIKIK